MLLSCVLSLSISFAQNSSGRLTGTVTDKDGKLTRAEVDAAGTLEADVVQS